jgi:hypothetical protein
MIKKSPLLFFRLSFDQVSDGYNQIPDGIYGDQEGADDDACVGYLNRVFEDRGRLMRVCEQVN